MKLLARLKDLTRSMTGKYIISLEVDGDPRELFGSLKDALIDCEIKKHANRRSLDANAFCWALCSDIGKALKPPLPKEEVYRNAIRGLGRYDLMLMRAEAVESFQRMWSNNGTGWFAEKAGESKEHAGYVWLYVYSGSSTYDSKEMAVLIDGLVQDAESLGIVIPLGKREIERLKTRWKKTA